MTSNAKADKLYQEWLTKEKKEKFDPLSDTEGRGYAGLETPKGYYEESWEDQIDKYGPQIKHSFRESGLPGGHFEQVQVTLNTPTGRPGENFTEANTRKEWRFKPFELEDPEYEVPEFEYESAERTGSVDYDPNQTYPSLAGIDGLKSIRNVVTLDPGKTEFAIPKSVKRYAAKETKIPKFNIPKYGQKNFKDARKSLRLQFPKNIRQGDG